VTSGPRSKRKNGAIVISAFVGIAEMTTLPRKAKLPTSATKRDADTLALDTKWT
jgi:hypothetical protein